jgi:hypothetical protein
VDALYLQAVCAQSGQVCAARDKGHVVTSAGQQPAVVAAHASTAHDADFHLFPLPLRDSISCANQMCYRASLILT